MKVEVSNVHLFEDSGNTKGICDLVFADAIRVKGVRVMDGSKGLFAAMPSRKTKDKEGKEEYESIVRFPDKDLQEQVNEAVVAAYEKKASE